MLKRSSQLSETEKVLNRAKRLDTVASEAGISAKRLHEAIKFYQTKDAEHRSQFLADKLEGRNERLQDSELDIFALRMPEHFILNMEHCLLVFAPTELPAQEILAALRKTPGANNRICVIISTERNKQQQLRHQAEDPARMLVIPNNIDLAELLMSSKPLDLFAKLIAGYVRVTRISPYQTRGGINNDTTFFGRTQLLAHILNRDPANYLLVGGRQLGKSSVLKTIERYYRDNPEVDCHYFSLSGEEHCRRFSKCVGIARRCRVIGIIAYARATRRSSVSINADDDADEFIKAEAERNYQLASIS